MHLHFILDLYRNETFTFKNYFNYNSLMTICHIKHCFVKRVVAMWFSQYSLSVLFFAMWFSQYS